MINYLGRKQIATIINLCQPNLFEHKDMKFLFSVSYILMESRGVSPVGFKGIEEASSNHDIGLLVDLC